MWIDNIAQQAQWFKAVLEEAREAEQYNKDSRDFYYSLRDAIMAMSEDCVQLRKYIIANKDKLESFAFYDSEVMFLEKRVEALEILIVNPGVTKEEAVAEQIKGICTRVDDGDTFYIGERLIRMAGTDAPEGGTKRGEVAGKVLSDLILGKEVDVRIDNHTPFDTYGRVLGVPYVEDQNISLEMVSRCMAEVNTKFGKHHFVDGVEFRQAADKCVMGWPLTGEVEIVSDPPKATVWIDGKDVGERTPAKVRLSIGIHQVVVFKTGYGAVHDSFTVKEPRKTELPPYKLQKIGVDAGLVEVHVDPMEAQAIVSAGGSVQGIAPVILELSTMEFSDIDVWADGYSGEVISVKPLLGRIVKVSVELKKQ